MTTSYMMSDLNDNVTVHNIVEHDEEWVHFMQNSVDFRKSNLTILPLIQKEYKGSQVPGYEGFYEQVCVDHRYELILIDGPFGNSGEFSRIDVLTYVPEMLAEDFIIMVDDTERKGEKNMCNEICNMLQANNIKYVCEEYRGVKNFTVIASTSHKFVCSMK